MCTKMLTQLTKYSANKRFNILFHFYIYRLDSQEATEALYIGQAICPTCIKLKYSCPVKKNFFFGFSILQDTTDI